MLDKDLSGKTSSSQPTGLWLPNSFRAYESTFLGREKAWCWNFSNPTKSSRSNHPEQRLRKHRETTTFTQAHPLQCTLWAEKFHMLCLKKWNSPKWNPDSFVPSMRGRMAHENGFTPSSRKEVGAGSTESRGRSVRSLEIQLQVSIHAVKLQLATHSIATPCTFFVRAKGPAVLKAVPSQNK